MQSIIGYKKTHLLDLLIKNKINVVKVFAPEHGFRGNIDAGIIIENQIDGKTKVPVVSLFGKNKKPTVEQLKDVEIVLFDIQDVGVRFFTYISTMHYVMEACAENNKTFVVLDRPNPLGDYVSGPIMKEEFMSFIGIHKIPIVHGLTIGELAQMINGEEWLKDKKFCNLLVIKLKNYKHSDVWNLPIKPSPNLPNNISIRLYPSLCLFEATDVSIGRGTEFPFQVIGYPDTTFGNFNFIPKDIIGMQTNPIHEGKKCYGIDLRKNLLNEKFSFSYFIQFYNKFENKTKFLTREKWFNMLVGNSTVIKMIKEGKSEQEISKSYEKELNEYKTMRKKYLLYEE